MAGAVGGILFHPSPGRCSTTTKRPLEARSAGYAILFIMCGSAYVVAFALNHLFAPRFDQIQPG